MQQADKEYYWSPYIAGACAGLVLVLSVWFTGEYFRGIDVLCKIGRVDRKNI